MSAASAYVKDCSDPEFDQVVLARSREVPVLVDFWAPWCGPCRALGPVLEKLAEEHAGGLELVKINIDENPVRPYQYGVRGIPHVILFRDGEALDQFVGALPEDAVRTFLRKHCPSEADKQVARGLGLLRGHSDASGADTADSGDDGSAAEPAGDSGANFRADAETRAAARAAFEAALAAQPDHAGARLALARLALIDGDLDGVVEHVRLIPPLSDEHETGEHLMQAATLVRSVKSSGQTPAEADANGLEARFAEGVHHLASGRYQDALDVFLAVAQQNRKWRDEAARRAMLTVFGIIGVRHPLSDKYRRELMILY